MRGATEEEIRMHQEANWQKIQPGFIVDLHLAQLGCKFALVVEKYEGTRTLVVVFLRNDNVMRLLKGEVPKTTRIKNTQVLNVHET